MDSCATSFNDCKNIIKCMCKAELPSLNALSVLVLEQSWSLFKNNRKRVLASAGLNGLMKRVLDVSIV